MATNSLYHHLQIAAWVMMSLLFLWIYHILHVTTDSIIKSLYDQRYEAPNVETKSLSLDYPLLA
jgi:hypothetical protein